MPPSMTMHGDHLDAAVAQAASGDRDALRDVLETIRPLVVRYCRARVGSGERSGQSADDVAQEVCLATLTALPRYRDQRSEEHTSELQSRGHLVCRLLLEKKKHIEIECSL